MKGLCNIGNTCYLNASLQLLIQNDDFCKIILIYRHHSPILNDISDFIMQYYINNDSSITPIIIKKIIHHHLPQYDNSMQHDASEFILSFFDLIDSEIKKINLSSLNLYSIYGIQSKTQFLCKNRHKNNMYENTLLLILDLELNDTTLTNLIQKYKSKEQLCEQSNNIYLCEHCNIHVPALKKTFITNVSSNLLILLKRFIIINSEYVKNNANITIPIIWNNEFKLVGAIIHYGGIHFGHYIYLSNINNGWFIFDDTNIKEISISDVDSILRYAYCIYYKKLLNNHINI